MILLVEKVDLLRQVIEDRCLVSCHINFGLVFIHKISMYPNNMTHASCIFLIAIP